MKTRLLSLLLTLTSLCMMAQGWPENYSGVMLQGFYWDGYADAQWSSLERQSDNLSTTFDLVWIPQSANCGGQSMGYDDLYWFSNYNSSFGTADELKSMISTFKAKGIGTIADIVINHRKNVSNWVDFPKETYKGVTYELQSTDICANDDGGETKTWATNNGYQLSANNDTGEDWGGMRDLDHKSTNVQNSVKAYLKMLLEDFGYVGFRYDMVKGYSGTYTKMYNEDAQPQYSVGECWDSSNTIKNWIDATGKTSAAFDFQFRYTVRNAINSQDWTKLAAQNDGSWPLVSSNYNSGSYRQYAVTFVENHDTEYRSSTAQQDPILKDTLAANAYLLAMPGTPCVFMKHWQAYKQEIANMVAVRKAVGINNMSVPTEVASVKDYYAVQVEGSGSNKLLCVVGTKADSYTPNNSNWKKVISGYHYAYFVQGIEPADITLPEIKEDEKPKDGVYDGVPSFCTIEEGEICAFFEAPMTWGSQIFTWAWMNGGDGKDYLGTSWPGVAATLLGTADNGNKVFKWVSTKTTAPDNIIFSGGGNQTGDLPFTNAGYYTKDGIQDVITASITSAEPYAVLKGDTLLTFFYDDKKTTRGGMSVGPFGSSSDVPWYNQREYITTAEFDPSFANCTTLTSTTNWFNGCKNMVSISGIEYLNTDNVTDMYSMFRDCSSLTSLDVSSFNTDNVQNMNSMFDGCSGLTSLDVSGFNTDNVTDMSEMFDGCSGLTSLDVTNFNTSNVWEMWGMFAGCSALTSLDLSSFNTANVTVMGYMFSGCSALTSLDVTNFNTSNVWEMQDMFSYCSALTSLDVSNFNTAKVTNMSEMFNGCSALTSLNVSRFNTANVTDMRYLFVGCSSLTSIDVSHFNTANVTDMSGMFAGCSSLTSLDVTGFNTGNVLYMGHSWSTYGGMFAGCSSLTSLDLSNFNTANVTRMDGMFLNCSNLKTIYVGSEWTTNAVKDGSNMFLDCMSLVGGAGTPYNANHVDYTYAHVDGGENNPGYLTWKGEGMTVNKLYIIGSGTAGEWNATTEMPFNDATKAFEYTIENTSTAWITFGIQPLNGDWGVFNNNYRYAIGNGNVVPVIGQEYQLVPSPETGSVMIEEKGKYFISVTKDLRMTIIKDGDEHPGTNIYVESEQAPYLYAFDANDQALNGEFPGNQMTKTVTIDGKQFWTTKISSTDPFNINIIDGNQYRTREIYVISDRYFTYLGLSSYRDVTEQYANAPEIQISSIALTGNHNEWGRNDLFTEVEPGKQYTMDVDLTNVTLEDDVMQFKLYANACAWLGITSLTLEAPSYVHSVGDPAVGASSRNIYMDLNEAPTRHFKFEAVWRGGTQMEEGWTLTITEVNPAEAEPYAVLSDNNTKLTFFYDEKKAMRGGMSVGPFYMNDAGYIEGRQWNDAVGSITTVVFDNSFVNCTSLTSTYGWFYGCKNLITITDISNLKTDNVADMSYMFSDCSSLKTLNVSGFKTDNVVNIWFMFSGCSSLTSLDVSGFNMGNVWGMYGMFSGCSKLTSLDLGNFNTENVRYMTGLFGECSSLTSLDVSGFNTTNVIDMNSMFRNCSSLTSLDLSNFNTSNVTDMSFMFWRCNNLLSLDISNFNTANAEMDRIFEECSSLASIKAGNANILTEEYAKIGNPNLLVYVNEARLAPSNVQNVVINGMAREIVLTDAQDGNNNWFAPLAFVAERISYTRNFEQSTRKGTSRGWESIALPFRVQTIQHETKGVIAPFNNSASNKHFWLRRLGDSGLQAATGIEANTPYVISMPNSEEYTADYNLNGRVTFSAQNVDVPATVTHTLALADSSIVMVPAMQRKERSSAVWALNVGEVRGSYFEGSVFERDYREVRPFEAYTVHRLENGQPAPRYVPLMDIGGTTGIETINAESLTVNKWYDLEGRKLQGKPTQKGVYISNGKKVVVK